MLRGWEPLPPLLLRLELCQDACCQPHVLLLPGSRGRQAAGSPDQRHCSFWTAAELPLLLGWELLLLLLHEGKGGSGVVGDGQRISGDCVLGTHCDQGKVASARVEAALTTPLLTAEIPEWHVQGGKRLEAS